MSEVAKRGDTRPRERRHILVQVATRFWTVLRLELASKWFAAGVALFVGLLIGWPLGLPVRLVYTGLHVASWLGLVGYLSRRKAMMSWAKGAGPLDFSRQELALTLCALAAVLATGIVVVGYVVGP